MIIQNNTHPGDTDEMPSSIPKNGKLKRGMLLLSSLTTTFMTLFVSFLVHSEFERLQES